MDGLDEVADPELRRRVSRLVEAFTRAFPKCRYMVASRIVGYIGPARLGENYKTTTVRDFSMADVEAFLKSWHRVLAIGQMGPGQSAETYAADQTRRLLQAIRDNERIRELAINPLMLTVIALVHRGRVKLPDRRADLYAEAVDVLLGKWDEARGVRELRVFKDKPLEAGDKRLALQRVALSMHENQQKEILAEELRRLLVDFFHPTLGDKREAVRSADRFLAVIEQRSGLLTARGEGVYAFSHLTFQEYLAALAVAAKDGYGYMEYTLARLHDKWWREVILLEAGYLSAQSKERTTRLIQAIADSKDKKEPFSNLVLASECARDAGANRVEGSLEKNIHRRLRKGVEKPPPLIVKISKRFGVKGWIEQRGAAMNALVRAGSGYWKPPYGEPEWIEIPAGECWMGEGEKADRGPIMSSGGGLFFGVLGKKHRVYLDAYAISRIPITNAQYFMFVKSEEREAPGHWGDKRPPRGLESHPVVNVSWYDAMAYSQWLSEMTAKSIGLPTQAQWEKAARGHKGRRKYPWGNQFDSTRCNSLEIGLYGTTPAGIFREGQSPYGCLDMTGNVWEWCADWYGEYPSGPFRNPSGPTSGSFRVIRGGGWFNFERDCHSAFRCRDDPGARGGSYGFRLVRSR